MTQQCIDASDIEPAALGMIGHVERYDRIGEIPAWAHDLERRWQEEETRARIRVSPEASALELSLMTNVPPQIAWEFLTRPGQRMSWQPWVTEVSVEGTIGGRRGPGSSNHCMHGKDAVVEEILDWRPYDYVTDRTTLDTPGGPVKILHTIELEPVTTGTRIHFRFASPTTRREKALMQDMGSTYAEALQSTFPTLIAQLDAALAARDTARGSEPELTRPRPGGPLSALQPLEIVD